MTADQWPPHAILPPDAQQALKHAAAQPERERLAAVDSAIRWVRALYPELFRPLRDG